MKYLVYNYGLGIAVGLLEQEGATEEINLAHNLYDNNANYSLFHGCINFSSFKQFKRFLILKEYFKICEENKQNKFNEYQFLRRAINRAKQLIKTNVLFHNFMSQIRSSTLKYNIGTYQDEIDYES